MPCAYWDEADTELRVGTFAEVGKTETPDFDGTIPTPSGIVAFTDAEMTELLAYPAPTAKTRLGIWTNGRMFPEKISIAMG